MKAAQRKSIGVSLTRIGWVFTAIGWVLSVGGVGIAAMVTLPFFLAGGNAFHFAMALLLMVALVAAGPVFVTWGDRLRFPSSDFALCPRCDYDLRGCPGAGCPECGWMRGATTVTAAGES